MLHSVYLHTLFRFIISIFISRNVNVVNIGGDNDIGRFVRRCVRPCTR